MSSDGIEELRKLSETLIDPEFAARVFEEGYPDAVIVVDQNANIKLLNRHTEIMFGYHRSFLYDKPIEILIPENDRERHVVHRNKYMTDPRSRPMGLGMVLQGRHKSGRTFDVEISLSPIVSPQGAFTVATIRKRRIADAAT